MGLAGFMGEIDDEYERHAHGPNVGRCLICDLPFSTEQGRFAFHEVCQCVEPEENDKGCNCPMKYRTLTFNDNYCRICGHNFIL